jgi:hypothetical protein
MSEEKEIEQTELDSDSVSALEYVLENVKGISPVSTPLIVEDEFAE